MSSIRELKEWSQTHARAHKHYIASLQTAVFMIMLWLWALLTLFWCFNIFPNVGNDRHKPTHRKTATCRKWDRLMPTCKHSRLVFLQKLGVTAAAPITRISSRQSVWRRSCRQNNTFLHWLKIAIIISAAKSHASAATVTWKIPSVSF